MRHPGMRTMTRIVMMRNGGGEEGPPYARRESGGLAFSLSLCGSSPRCDTGVPGSVPRGTTWFLRSLGIYLSPPKDMLSFPHALL